MRVDRRLADRHLRRRDPARDDLGELLARHPRHVDLHERALDRARARGSARRCRRRRRRARSSRPTSWSESDLDRVGEERARLRGRRSRSNSSTKTTISRCCDDSRERLADRVRRHRPRGRAGWPAESAALALRGREPDPARRVADHDLVERLAPDAAEVVARVAGRPARRAKLEPRIICACHVRERRLADAALAVDDRVLARLADRRRRARRSARCGPRTDRGDRSAQPAGTPPPTSRIRSSCSAPSSWRRAGVTAADLLRSRRREKPRRRTKRTPGLWSGSVLRGAVERRSAAGAAGAGAASCSSRGSHWSQLGQVPVPSPSSFIVAGRSTARTMVASIRTAAARPIPISFMSMIGSVAKTAKTPTMTMAALVTTPAVVLMPCATASARSRCRGRRPRGSGSG